MEQPYVTMIHRGVFFRAEGDDCIILHNLAGYQINRQKNGVLYCGFPEHRLEYVAKLLAVERVSYQAIWEGKDFDNDICKQEAFQENRYDLFKILKESDELQIHDYKCRSPDNVPHQLKKGVSLTEDEKNAYEFLKWMSGAAQSSGVACTVDLSDESVHAKLMTLQNMVSRWIGGQ